MLTEFCSDSAYRTTGQRTTGRRYAPRLLTVTATIHKRHPSCGRFNAPYLGFYSFSPLGNWHFSLFVVHPDCSSHCSAATSVLLAEMGRYNHPHTSGSSVGRRSIHLLHCVTGDYLIF